MSRLYSSPREYPKHFGGKIWMYHWEKITYLILIPDDFFWVVPCVSCVRQRTSRETNIELFDKILPYLDLFQIS